MGVVIGIITGRVFCGEAGSQGIRFECTLAGWRAKGRFLTSMWRMRPCGDPPPLQVESGQWWLPYKSKPGGKEREIANLNASAGEVCGGGSEPPLHLPNPIMGTLRGQGPNLVLKT